MNLRTFVPLGVLTIALLVGAGALATYGRDDTSALTAKQAPLTGGNIAVVDMQEVYDHSDAPALVAQKANEAEQGVIQLLKRLSTLSYLNQQELVEYLQIATTPAPTPAQQDRIKELETLSSKRAQELAALSTKPEANLTPADKQRMQDLQNQARAVQDAMPAIQNDLQSDARAQVDVFRREQMRRLRAVVGKVAAARGIYNVWNVECLPYSANDITAEVVRKVSKPGK